jgi:hypothetical protein
MAIVKWFLKYICYDIPYVVWKANHAYVCGKWKPLLAKYFLLFFFWEHAEEHFGSPFGSLGTPWELDGTTLGTLKFKIFKTT